MTTKASLAALAVTLTANALSLYKLEPHDCGNTTEFEAKIATLQANLVLITAAISAISSSGSL
jgi:hypothetical protein